MAGSPLARARRVLYHSIDSLLHPSLRSGEHAGLWLARLLVAVCLLIQLPLLRIPFNHFVFGVELEPVLLAVVLCASAALLSIPLLLRVTGRLGLCSHLYLGILSALLAFANLRTGGVVATVLGTASVVVAAMVLTGPRAGISWSAVATGQLVLTFFLARGGYEFPFPVPDEVIRMSRPMTTLTFMAVIVAFLWINERLRKDAMRSLMAARDGAHAAAKAKSEFLAIMSHEIRTPMNGVLDMSELLLSGQLAAEERSHAETIHSSSEALLTIINDILDFSRIEAGRLSLETVAFDLEELIGSCATVFALPAEKKRLNLICFAEPETPLLLRGDPARLRQILLNLLGNALKFTNEGDVCLRVSLRSSADTIERGATHRHLLLFEIGDSGIGISPENQLALFQAFAQADSSTTRKFGGTGLGLGLEAAGGAYGRRDRRPERARQGVDVLVHRRARGSH